MLNPGYASFDRETDISSNSLPVLNPGYHRSTEKQTRLARRLFRVRTLSELSGRPTVHQTVLLVRSGPTVVRPPDFSKPPPGGPRKSARPGACRAPHVTRRAAALSGRSDGGRRGWGAPAVGERTGPTRSAELPAVPRDAERPRAASAKSGEAPTARAERANSAQNERLAREGHAGRRWPNGASSWPSTIVFES